MGLGDKGRNLPSKELQVQCHAWAGLFRELQLPSCKCPGEEGHGRALPWGPEGRETPVAQARALGAACVGRLWEPSCSYGAVRPLCSRARNGQQQPRSCASAGPKPCPAGCWPHAALAGPGCRAHPGVTTSRCERCWVGQPGGSWCGAFPACKSRSRIVLTQQQR